MLNRPGDAKDRAASGRRGCNYALSLSKQRTASISAAHLYEGEFDDELSIGYGDDRRAFLRCRSGNGRQRLACRRRSDGPGSLCRKPRHAPPSRVSHQDDDALHDLRSASPRPDRLENACARVRDRCTQAADEARRQGRRNDHRRRGCLRHDRPFGQRRGGSDGRAAWRFRGRLRENDERKGTPARHETAHSSSTLRVCRQANR